MDKANAITASFRRNFGPFSLDIDLTLPARGVIGLFGASGSGKTTLLRCVAGLERVADGRLRIGEDVWQDGLTWLPTHKRPLGYVFQEASLFPHLTVIKNLRYGMRRVKGAHRVSLDEAIELLGIGHLLDRRPDHLSGGERQRVAIARALAVSPRLLLMDEPLAALDLKRRQEILPYLDRLHDELRVPVLYVTHSSEEVGRLADHLVVLEKGRAVANGPLADVLADPGLSIHQRQDASVIVLGTVAEVDHEWHLSRIQFSGGNLWVPDHGGPCGKRVRVQILARDVSLATHLGTSSIQNCLPGVVDMVRDGDHPGLALVRVRVGDTVLLASLTKRAVAQLALKPGQQLWAQVKALALKD